jgi:hypothetical protein
MTAFVIGMTSARNWFHVAVLVGGKQRFDPTSCPIIVTTESHADT